MRWILALTCLFATGAVAQPHPPPGDLEISLLTFGPGEIYWERFGHNAIVVRDRVSGTSSAYNYGMFDFEEDDFLVNFARGHMTYQIVANRADEDIAWYAGEGRFVVEQVLRFDPAQALALKQFLDWNVQPGNARYRYDYYTSNCSTRVRDALDEALGGALRKQLSAPSRGYSYRMLTGALMSPQPLLMGVLDAGLGPYADRRLSFWEDSFVPMELMTHLRDVTVAAADGSRLPLVVEERVHATASLAAPPKLPPDLRWPFLIAGLMSGGLLFALDARRERRAARRLFAILAIAISIACGATGLVLLALWGLTDHRSAWSNENLLVFSPLCLLLVPTWWRAARSGWAPSRFARAIAILIAVLAALALFSKVLPWFVQANLPWILLVLPAHLALALATTSAPWPARVDGRAR